MRQHSRRPSPRRSAPLREEPVPITTEYVTLGQLLKISGLIGTGGQARPFLEEYVMKVNGEDEQRRGRKLYAGDLIIAPDGRRLRIVVEEAPEREV